jgi:hypothetical protein
VCSTAVGCVTYRRQASREIKPTRQPVPIGRELNANEIKHRMLH